MTLQRGRGIRSSLRLPNGEYIIAKIIVHKTKKVAFRLKLEFKHLLFPF